MLRKTLVVLMTVAALGVGSAAMARGGGGGGGHSGGFGGGHVGGGWGGRGMAPMRGGWGGRVGAFSGRHFVGRPFARNAFVHNKFHRFHRQNAFFFGAGFAGPWYYGYYDLPPYTFDDAMTYSTPETVVLAPEPPRAVGCQHSQQTVTVPSENGETSQVTIIRC